MSNEAPTSPRADTWRNHAPDAPSTSGSDSARAIDDALAASIARDLPSHARIAVALSGGRDSVTLLHALARVAAARGHALVALHVEHGLSPHAARWHAFCADLCARTGIGFQGAILRIARAGGQSLEAQARRARYEALAQLATRAGATHVALAHHRDDQAETVLLQLLRGAGPRGLSGMPVVREGPHGITWWRPLLDVDRAAIDAYVAAHALAHVEDESNASHRHRRNALRHTVIPALRAISPHATATIARAAAHQAEAAQLADDLARLDAKAVEPHAIARDQDGAPTLARSALVTLPPHRARNLLRFYLRELGLAAPSTARLAQMLAQLTQAAPDSRVEMLHDGVALGLHRDRVHVHAVAPPPYAVTWQGEPTLALPHGTLSFTRGPGGFDPARFGTSLVARPRTGGERFQVAPDRPRRALKATLHDAGWPHWQRRDVPLLIHGDTLVAVPGLGVDAACAPHDAAEGIVVRWRPTPLAPETA